jgi:hypothetical protein
MRPRAVLGSVVLVLLSFGLLYLLTLLLFILLGNGVGEHCRDEWSLAEMEAWPALYGKRGSSRTRAARSGTRAPFHQQTAQVPPHTVAGECSKKDSAPDSGHGDPIDVVFTWVDSSDPLWQVERERVACFDPDGSACDNSAERFPLVAPTGGSDAELCMAISSIQRFAPWVRRIWVVTARAQRPTCAQGMDRVRIVHHDEIWEPRHAHGLPVFNSHAIEAHLDRIPGLAERFIYMNDDCFFGNYVFPHHFFVGGHSVVATGFNHQGLVVNVQQSAYSLAWRHLVALDGPHTGAMQQWIEAHAVYFGLPHVGIPLLRAQMQRARVDPALAASWAATAVSRFRSGHDIPPVGATVRLAWRDGSAFAGSGIGGGHSKRLFGANCTASRCRAIVPALVRRPVAQVCINQTAIRADPRWDVDAVAASEIMGEVHSTIRADVLAPPPPRTVPADKLAQHLLVVVHAGDEVVFGVAPLLLARNVHVLCLTRAPTATRRLEFLSVCAASRASGEMLHFADDWDAKRDEEQVAGAVLETVKSLNRAGPGPVVAVLSQDARVSRGGHPHHAHIHRAVAVACVEAAVPLIDFASASAGVAASVQPSLQGERRRLLHLYTSRAAAIARGDTFK